VFNSALIVGVGGLGCPVSLGLAQRGIKKLILVDDDTVQLSNLHRQLWHHQADVGRLKVESAAAKIRTHFPMLEVEAKACRADPKNLDGLSAEADVVFDCTDGASTKLMLSDFAARTQKTLIYAGVIRFEGLVMRIAAGGPCLRCLFEAISDDAPTCAQAGILGSMAGVVGGLQVEAAYSAAPPFGQSVLQVVDGADLSVRQVKVRRRANCVAC
jgi:molybdopterin-synthase adenylyltransferase